MIINQVKYHQKNKDIFIVAHSTNHNIRLCPCGTMTGWPDSLILRNEYGLPDSQENMCGFIQDYS